MPIPGKIPAIRFNLKDSSNSDKETLIYLFFRYNGKRLKYSTGEKVKPNYWDGRRAKSTKNHPEYAAINSRLNNLENHTKDIFTENNFGEISLADFKLELDYRSGKKSKAAPQAKEEKGPPTLFEFIEIFIEEEKNKEGSKRGTWKKYITIQTHLKKYSRKKNLDYKDIDWHFRKSFLNWLYKAPRNHSINNASKVFEVIKQFMQESYKLRYHTNTTHLEKGFGVKRVRTKNKVRLDFQEIKQVMNLDLSQNNRLEKVRDLFIVGCYTGLRYSDWYKVNRDNLLSEDGKELLEIFTQKTNQQVYIPCLPELKNILEKYDYNLPKISSQKFNDYIKEVAELAKINTSFQRVYSTGGTIKNERIEKFKKISSHAARRSFASNFYDMGISPFILMQITGHTTEKQFFEYIDVDAKKLALRFGREVSAATKKANPS